MHNQKKTRGTSQYKGVHWYKAYKMWAVDIKIGKNRLFGAYFPADQEIEAAKAYDNAAIKHFGEYAMLNFPKNKIS